MDCLFLPKCLLLQSPGFGVLNVRKKKQQACISVSRRPSYVTSSLSVAQTGSDILVKEKTEFKSSFDEYLKAMESIRADREKPKDQKEGGGDRKKLKDVTFTKSAPKNPRQEEPRMWKRANGSNFDEKDEVYRRSNVVSAKPRPSSAFQERVAVSSQKEINHKRSKDYSSENVLMDMTAVRSSKHVWKKSMPMNEMSNDYDLEIERKRSKDHSSENVSMDMTAVRSSKHVWKKSMPMDEMSNDNDLMVDYKRSKDYSSGNVLMDMTAVKSSKRVWKKSMPMDEMSNDDDLEMEKFIFQTSELNGDIQGGPRVSQMEMEERIQKLALCLNEANVKMPEWMFSKTMRSAKIKFSDHSMMRIIQILGKMGNWRMVLQLVEWLQMQERYMSRKIGYVYTAALGVLGKARRPVEALNLFSSMQRHRSSYPDIVAYHSISVTLGQAGHMKELFDVIDSMRSIPANFKIEDWDPRLEPDLVIYNAVLNACVTRKEWEGAFWVLQKLAEIDQQPSSTTYGLLMEVMLACGKYDLVHEFFRQMQASSAPNALTYRVLVNTLWREGKPEEAITAVEEMESRGLVGSASLYYDLARCLCSAGRCEEALMQVDKICKVASKPLVVTYTGLMQACFDSGKVEDGIFIFKHMQKYCSPNQVTCNVMLKAYLAHGMFTEAKELFQKMLQSGQQGSRPKPANSQITADIHTFSLMLESCVKENRWDDFDYAYNQMLHHGYSFNIKRHLGMVLQASKAGKEEVVETTWSHLMKSKRVPPPALVKERFRLKMENDDLVAAMSSVASHPSSDQKSFSKKAWSKLLDDNAHRFNKEALVHLMQEIDVSMSNSELPNLICQNLRDSCAKFAGLEPITGTTKLNETPIEVCI